jgi:hypothetical protein
MGLLRNATEGLARKTTRRGFFGKSANMAFGALAGAAVGAGLRHAAANHAGNTVCIFPGPPCPCGGCLSNGTCAKPCIIMTQYYASGCWVTGSITCCDCDCNGHLNLEPAHGHSPGQPAQTCGCGSDFHNNPSFCP